MAEVTPQTLLLGSRFALEQCGRLLEDAVTLFEHSRHATAAGLALFAREELGRHRILLEFWRTGSPVSVAAVEAACGDHVDKQDAAVLSMVYRGDRDGQIGKLLQAQTVHAPGTPEYRRAADAMAVFDKRQRQQQPHERHERRMRAFYVDVSSKGDTWLRPCAGSATECGHIVTDAINDYTLALQRIDQAGLLYGDLALADAIAALPERVTLPVPRHIPTEIMLGLLGAPPLRGRFARLKTWISLMCASLKRYAKQVAVIVGERLRRS